MTIDDELYQLPGRRLIISVDEIHQTASEGIHMSIQRIVCFKFKAGASQEAIRQHMQDFAGMMSEIPQILEYRGGFTGPGDDNRMPDYDCMHYMVFDGMDDIEIYRPHPAHMRFIECNKAVWENVLVLNAEI